jgi:hypothetical protein
MRGVGMRGKLLVLVSAVIILLTVAGCGSQGAAKSANATANDKVAATRLASVGMALNGWADAHMGRYPTAELVSADGVWKAQMDGGPWPQNPWTGQPMTQGQGPGQFTYTLGSGRGSATLTLYGENGTVLRTVSLPGKT